MTHPGGSDSAMTERSTPDPEEFVLDLEFQYVERTPARKAKAHLKKRKGKKRTRWLRRLLRHHSEFPDGVVEEADTYRRDQFDFLLSFYGLLEVASMMRLVPEELPKKIGQTAREALHDPWIKRYYEVNYPLLLPKLLRWRLDGFDEVADVVALPRQTFEVFERFRLLSRNMDFDDNSSGKNVERFLWLLDGGVVDDDEDIDSLLAIVADPDRYARRIIKPVKKGGRSDLDQALIGFGIFLAFAVEFDAFLDALKEYRQLQSALWHHHGYWFRAFHSLAGGEVRSVIRQVVDTKAKRYEPLRGAGGQALAALGRLCSGRYEYQLGEFM
jgi:hypothetical protein